MSGFLLALIFSFTLKNVGDIRWEWSYLKNIDEFQSLSFLGSRFRISPELEIVKGVKVSVQIDVNWWDGSEESFVKKGYSIVWRRAYFKWITPLGLFSGGRTPNEWGLGMFVNSGDGYDWRFGLKRYGDIVDRILFATKPLGKNEPLLIAFAFDRISEDYMWTNYDDVDEYLIAILWEGERLSGGVYSAYRHQSSTRSDIYAMDAWMKFVTENFRLEGEGVIVLGKSGALPLLYELNEKRKVLQSGLAFEGEWRYSLLRFYLQTGFASGDEDIAGGDLTFFIFNPDYNVGLIMFERALAYFTARSVKRILNVSNEQKGIDAYSTEGGVMNAVYVFPQVELEILKESLRFRIGWLFARGVRDFVDPYYTFFIKGGKESGFFGDEPSKDLGWEIDVRLRYDYKKIFTFLLEGGYFQPGEVFKGAETSDAMYSIEGRVIIIF